MSKSYHFETALFIIRLQQGEITIKKATMYVTGGDIPRIQKNIRKAEEIMPDILNCTRKNYRLVSREELSSFLSLNAFPFFFCTVSNDARFRGDSNDFVIYFKSVFSSFIFLNGIEVAMMIESMCIVQSHIARK